MRSKVVRFEEVEDSYYGGIRKMGTSREEVDVADFINVAELFDLLAVEESEKEEAETSGVRIGESNEVLSIEVCETLAGFVVKGQDADETKSEDDEKTKDEDIEKTQDQDAETTRNYDAVVTTRNRDTVETTRNRDTETTRNQDADKKTEKKIKKKKEECWEKEGIGVREALSTDRDVLRTDGDVGIQ